MPLSSASGPFLTGSGGASIPAASAFKAFKLAASSLPKSAGGRARNILPNGRQTAGTHVRGQLPERRHVDAVMVQEPLKPPMLEAQQAIDQYPFDSVSIA